MESMAFALSRWGAVVCCIRRGNSLALPAGYAVVPGFMSQERCDAIREEAIELDFVARHGKAMVASPGTTGQLGAAAAELRNLGLDLEVELATNTSICSPYSIVRNAHQRAASRAALGLQLASKAVVSKRRGGAHTASTRSLVVALYLNRPDWAHGGHIAISRPGHHKHSALHIPPKAGTLVVFWANVKFHLQPATDDCFALSVVFSEPQPNAGLCAPWQPVAPPVVAAK